MSTIYQIKDHLNEHEIMVFTITNKDKDHAPRGMGDREKSLQASLSRTRRAIKDYARNNNFDYFCTFTFNPKKVESSNHKAVSTATQRYTRQLREKSIEWLIVPELHADGHKIHLHALIKGQLQLKDSGKKDKAKRTIYNVPSWPYGYSTAIKIERDNESTVKIANYIIKYITKDLLINYDKKRYWVSKSLAKPKIIERDYNPCPQLMNAIEWDYRSNKSDYRSKTIPKTF